jgi:hypothetical protein
MVLNTTFNNISVISWRSVLLVEETGGPGENANLSQSILYIFQIYLDYFSIVNVIAPWHSAYVKQTNKQTNINKMAE